MIELSDYDKRIVKLLESIGFASDGFYPNGSDYTYTSIYGNYKLYIDVDRETSSHSLYKNGNELIYMIDSGEEYRNNLENAIHEEFAAELRDIKIDKILNETA